MLNLRAFIKGLLVQEETDRTKELSIEVDSSATTETRTTLKSSQTANRTVNLPDADDTLMGRATADTVSNKILDNSNSATFVDNSLTIQGDGDATKQAQFNADTISTATTRTLSLPDGDTTLLGADTTQTVENKTIDGTAATGNNTITADADNITYDNSTSGLTAVDLQAAVDEVESRLDSVETGKLDGPGTHADNILLKTDGVNSNDLQVTGITIDDSNNVTGVNDLTVDGDLTVNGTTTTLNTATLDVEDTNITVNKNGTDGSAEGAGLTIERAGTDGSLIYEDALASKFKLGALGSEVEIADVSSSQTLTNKDASDPTNNIDTASADSLTRLTGNQQLVTIPDTASPDNFVLEDYVQALTNKDIDGGTASDTSRITIPSDTKTNLDGLTRKEGTIVYATDLDKFFGDDGTELFEIGSGGESGKNYFTGGNFEINVDLATTYNDGGSYVDGTGGSPTVVSVSQNSTTPLAGDSDLQIAKAASDAAGEGVTLLSDTIDRVDQGKDLYFIADIDASHANYTTDDIQLKAYDVTNAEILTIIPVSSLTDNNGIFNSQARVIGRILCNSDTAQIRVSLHFETDSNTGSASNIYVDDARLTPDTALIGSIITEWQSYTPTGTWPEGTYKGRWRRVGDTMQVEASWDKTGSDPSGTFSLDLPPGYTIDTDKLSDNGGAGSDVPTLGFGWAVDAGGGAQYPLQVIIDGTDAIRLVDDSAGLVNPTSPFAFSAGDALSVNFTVPISEWTAGNLLSAHEASFSTAKVKYRCTTQSLPNNGVQRINFNSVDYDDLGLVTTGASWVFTAPRRGTYCVLSTLKVGSSSSWDDGESIDFRLFVNGSQISTLDTFECKNSTSNNFEVTLQGMERVQLEQGDTIDLRVFQNTGASANLVSTGSDNFISISEEPDFSIFGVFGETEYKEVILTTNVVTTTAGVAVDITGASLALSPGEWQVGYGIPGFTDWISGSNGINRGVVITDSANTFVPGSESNFYSVMANGDDDVSEYFSNVVNITVTEPDTYKLRIRCSQSNTVAQFFADITSSFGDGIFWARRMK